MLGKRRSQEPRRTCQNCGELMAAGSTSCGHCQSKVEPAGGGAVALQRGLFRLRSRWLPLAHQPRFKRHARLRGSVSPLTPFPGLYISWHFWWRLFAWPPSARRGCHETSRYLQLSARDSRTCGLTTQGTKESLVGVEIEHEEFLSKHLNEQLNITAGPSGAGFRQVFVGLVAAAASESMVLYSAGPSPPTRASLRSHPISDSNRDLPFLATSCAGWR